MLTGGILIKINRQAAISVSEPYGYGWEHNYPHGSPAIIKKTHLA